MTRSFKEKITNFWWKITKLVATIISLFFKPQNVYIKVLQKKNWGDFGKKIVAKVLRKSPHLVTLASTGEFSSAARKFEQKRAKFLKNPKDLHQTNFKISKDLHQRPAKVINIYIKALKIMLKTGLNRFFKQFLKNRPKNRQILKSPKQNFGRQMVQKVTQMAINRQIWQHWKRCLLTWGDQKNSFHLTGFFLVLSKKSYRQMGDVS